MRYRDQIYLTQSEEVCWTTSHLLFSDILQPQWEPDLRWRCSWIGCSVASEPEPSDTKVSPALHILLLKRCTLGLQQWLCTLLTGVAVPVQYMVGFGWSYWNVASFPGLPRFLFFVQYNTRRRKSAKNGEGLGTLITWMTSGGREVDVGGTVPDYKYVRNKPESGFLTGQAEYSRSCERLGSCLETERSMMKSSALFHEFKCGPLLPYVHLASTWRYSRDKCSQAFPVFALFYLRVLYWTQTEEQKTG